MEKAGLGSSLSGESGVSWQGLLSGIREAFSGERVDVDAVTRLLSSYRSRREDWQQFAKFDTHRSVERKPCVDCLV